MIILIIYLLHNQYRVVVNCVYIPIFQFYRNTYILIYRLYIGHTVYNDKMIVPILFSNDRQPVTLYPYKISIVTMNAKLCEYRYL